MENEINLKILVLNNHLHYIPKANSTVCYLYYHLYRFDDIAHILFQKILKILKNKNNDFKDIPLDFIKYLKEKQILVED